MKALSEELENPDNTHRWRRLEGSDPGTYEMVQKIQALQKRLISKTEVSRGNDGLPREIESRSCMLGFFGDGGPEEDASNACCASAPVSC